MLSPRLETAKGWETKPLPPPAKLETPKMLPEGLVSSQTPLITDSYWWGPGVLHRLSSPLVSQMGKLRPERGRSLVQGHHLQGPMCQRGEEWLRSRCPVLTTLCTLQGAGSTGHKAGGQCSPVY